MDTNSRDRGQKNDRSRHPLPDPARTRYTHAARVHESKGKWRRFCWSKTRSIWPGSSAASFKPPGTPSAPAADGETALALHAEVRPDVMILDWMLPRLDGLGVLRQIRQHAATPVLMLTARSEEIDRVMGLEVGADDYLTKPFSMRELLARVHAMLRRVPLIQQTLQAERDAVTALLRNRREPVASVSHELRTPVATLRGTLGPLLSRNGDDLPADLRRDLVVMDHETERLQRLIDDLFALSRAELGELDLHPQPVDAGAVIRRAVEAAAPLLWSTTKVELIADVPPGLPPVRADTTRLEQILHNLLRHGARDHRPGRAYGQ